MKFVEKLIFHNFPTLTQSSSSHHFYLIILYLYQLKENASILKAITTFKINFVEDFCILKIDLLLMAFSNVGSLNWNVVKREVLMEDSCINNLQLNSYQIEYGLQFNQIFIDKNFYLESYIRSF